MPILSPRTFLARPIAVVSSQQCPGALILRAHDLAQAWAQADINVIGGFHSPVEAEMLRVLLRGQGQLVVVAARGLSGMRVPKAWQAAMNADRLMIVSPFADAVRRTDTRIAYWRNLVVAQLAWELAGRVLVLHAAPESGTERMALDWLAAGREVWTLEQEANAVLLRAGARVWDESSTATSIEGGQQ